MLREPNRAKRVGVKGATMTDREAALHGLGVALNAGMPGPGDAHHFGADSPFVDAAFSGYGAFTPISVSPDGHPRDADISRRNGRD